ncbi:MAG: FAD-binding protein, partial [Pseudaminobacter sp.]
MKICGRYAVPVIPYGAGTSVEGHVLALQGGVTVDLSAMNRIVEIRERDLDATVEAGVTRLQLDGALRSCGLFF